MDIKSKKSRSFLVWCCFFIAVNILVLSFVCVIFNAQNIINNRENIFATIRLDVKKTTAFKHALTLHFNSLAEYIKYEEAEALGALNEKAEILEPLNDEKDNVLYFIQSPEGNVIVANTEYRDLSVDGIITLPEGYDYCLFFDGKDFFTEYDGQSVNIFKGVYVSGVMFSNVYNTLRTYTRDESIIKNYKIMLMVKENLNEHPYSRLYLVYRGVVEGRWIFFGALAFLLIGLALFFISLKKRKIKKEFDDKLADFSGKFWIEFKLIIAFVLLCIISSFERFSTGLFVSSFLLLWLGYVYLMDLLRNKREFLRNNSINTMIRRYRAFERKKPFQKALLQRVYFLLAAECVLLLFAWIFTGLGIGYSKGGYFIFVFLLVVTGFYLAYRFIRRYTNTVTHLGMIQDFSEAMKNGNLETSLNLYPDADLQVVSENLNQIQDGLKKAVDEKVRSERMKVELVTNVSHDLKTPLTSIISYTDLLSKEEGLPEHVNDYVTILQKKSQRLNTLIQDLFELSKVTSGETRPENEKLDLGKLIRQTLADMDEQIRQSKLAFKVDIPEEPIFIQSDGKKLYRVFLNLVSNTLKYSLEGSRVFVELTVNKGVAAVCIKNTANYEMDFCENEIIERFTRSDKTRSTEGSGLGLAIAQSFTQACSGDFKVTVDGDLFKVLVSFPLMGEGEYQ